MVGFSVSAEERTEQDRMIAVQKIQILDRSLIMVGMGLTQLMSDDYYIGALYLDDAAVFSEEEDLLLLDVPRSMQFLFASERSISGRGFGRMLGEAIRINNIPGDIDKEKDRLKAFLGLFKGNYQKGDKIRFDFHHTFGTRVYHNDKQIGEFENAKELYRLLLRMWIGNRPPSSIFKNGIIGKNDDDTAISLLRRYVSF